MIFADTGSNPTGGRSVAVTDRSPLSASATDVITDCCNRGVEVVVLSTRGNHDGIRRAVESEDVSVESLHVVEVDAPIDLRTAGVELTETLAPLDASRFDTAPCIVVDDVTELCRNTDRFSVFVFLHLLGRLADVVGGSVLAVINPVGVPPADVGLLEAAFEETVDVQKADDSVPRL